MEKIQFKTNIKCSGCVDKVTPYLNEVAGAANWEVDLQDPRKLLTVSVDKKPGAAEVIKAISDAGYRAEAVS